MKVLLLSFLFSLCFLSLKAQMNDTILYFKANGEITDDKNAVNSIQVVKINQAKYTIKHSEKDDNSKWKVNQAYEVITIVNDNLLKQDTYYDKKLKFSEDIERKKTDSKLYYFKEVNRKGFTSSEYYSKFPVPLTKDSIETRYYLDINEKLMKCLYENNVQISCAMFDRSGNMLADNLKTSCEILPTYKDKGLEYFREVVQKEMIYPPYAVERNISGRVIVQFVVTSEGKLGTVHILRGVDESLDNESIRAIKATKPFWKPGYDNGKPVNMIMVMPLIFQIQ